MTGEWIALVFARWLNFVAVAGLFGMALFPLYVPEAARGAYLAQRTMRSLMIVGGALTLASTFAWAGAALVNMAGDGSALWDRSAWLSFLFDTSFGLAWVARGALAIAIMLTICGTRGRSAFAAVVALSAGLLISQAWVGHVASLAAPARWGVTLAYALHVLGAGAWFGGLLSLAIAMKGPRAIAASERKTAEELLVRFSSVGLAAVAAIIIGGLINMLAHGAFTPEMLFASSWGRALAVKVALVVGMLLLAGANRFILMPRLSRGEASALPTLGRSVLIEQVLGLAVLVLTAALGVLDPST